MGVTRLVVMLFGSTELEISELAPVGPADVALGVLMVLVKLKVPLFVTVDVRRIVVSLEPLVEVAWIPLCVPLELGVL